ncbi:MAG: GntR family transcriptional regulator [Marinicellaceae bacterium]
MTIEIQSSADIIANKIRNSIISGEFPSGQSLNQDKLSRIYKVSKIPIREALNQLKTEGLITFKNNRGSHVSSLSCDEVEEIYTIRMALEEIALKRSIPDLQEKDFIAAESILKLIDVSNNYLDWSKLNWKFHAAIYKSANMPKLLNMVSVLHNNVSRYLLLYLKDLNFQKISQDEHWQLFNLCRERNTKAAVELLKMHMQEALNITVIHMKENKI